MRLASIASMVYQQSRSWNRVKLYSLSLPDKSCIMSVWKNPFVKSSPPFLLDRQVRALSTSPFATAELISVSCN